MKDTEAERKDSESILIALDQISQTISVMTNVVEKLREQYTGKEKANNAKTSMENSNQFQEGKTNKNIN